MRNPVWRRRLVAGVEAAVVLILAVLAWAMMHLILSAFDHNPARELNDLDGQLASVHGLFLLSDGRRDDLVAKVAASLPLIAAPHCIRFNSPEEVARLVAYYDLADVCSVQPSTWWRWCPTLSCSITLTCDAGHLDVR